MRMVAVWILGDVGNQHQYMRTACSSSSSSSIKKCSCCSSCSSGDNTKCLSQDLIPRQALRNLFLSLSRHSSAYVSRRQHTSAYNTMVARESTFVTYFLFQSLTLDSRATIVIESFVTYSTQHTSASASISQHTSAYVSIHNNGRTRVYHSV